MQVTMKEDAPCRRTLEIEVPVETVNSRYQEMMVSYRKQARIPGFRPGKAPQNLVEKRYGRKILEDMKDQLLAQAYQDAVKQEKMKVLNVLNVSDAVVERDKPFRFSVTVDVPPAIELPEYKGIKVKSEKQETTDEDLEGALKQLLERFADFEEVKGRPVQEHDVIQVEFKGTCEGKEITELAPDAEGISASESSWVAADENEFLPGLGTGMIGTSVGDEKDITVTFPEDFQVKELAGKEAVYQVKLKAIRTKVLPELNEDLFKKLHVESEEQLRSLMKQDMEQQRETAEQNRRKSEIVKYLLANQQFDLPDSVLQEETRNAVYDLVRQNTQRGVKEENITENKEKIFEAASQSAAERVKVKFLLERIADEEDIQVGEGEVRQYLMRMAMSYGMTEDQLRKQLQERNALGEVRSDVRRQKTLDFLLNEAVIEE
jgi:trigger factor